jgi:hypothetical protein
MEGELESEKVETSKIRKGYEIHFIKSDRLETITETTKPGSRVHGELKTDEGEYSVDYIQRWREFGFLKIYKK